MKGLLQLDGGTIWENGSKTFPPFLKRKPDPPETWTYPPLMGGIPVEVADVPPPVVFPTVKASAPPVFVSVPEIPLLPASPSPTDVWARWQQLVRNWGCLADWGGGLDALTTRLGGDMPIYVVGNDKMTAIGWWKFLQKAGYDKATRIDDLSKGIGVSTFFGIDALIHQFNDLAGRARLAGYPGCPASVPSLGAAGAASPNRPGFGAAAAILLGGAALVGVVALVAQKRQPSVEPTRQAA